MASVFLSYRQENATHCQRVREFAIALRTAGIRVVLDVLENEEAFNEGGPSEGWPKWCYAQVTANERVLIIGTPSYYAVYENRAPAGVGVGAANEANRIFQILAGARGINPHFRVVLLAPGDEAGLPDHLKGYHVFRPNEHPDELKKVITWLSAAPGPAGGSPGPPVPAGPAHHGHPGAAFPVVAQAVGRDGFVDCADTFATFERMLTEGATERVLLIEGHGNHGKSRLLNIFYHHTRAVLGAASAARVELKKPGPTPDEHLRGMARALGVPAPTGLNLDDRTHALLDACVSRPVVLLFDSYEHAEQNDVYWVNLFLERALDATLLRCLVAGRKVPAHDALPWAKCARHTHCDALHDKDAVLRHALALGYKGRPEDIELVRVCFLNMRERAVREGWVGHNVSCKAFLEEIQSMCAGGGSHA